MSKVVTIDVSEFRTMRDMYNSSTQVQASIETRTRHLTSGGVSVTLGAPASKPSSSSSSSSSDREPSKSAEELNLGFQSMIEGSERYLSMHGISFISKNENNRPVVLDPEMFQISFMENRLGERIYRVVHRSAGATNALSDSMMSSVNGAPHVFDESQIGANVGAPTSKGSNKKRKKNKKTERHHSDADGPAQKTGQEFPKESGMRYVSFGQDTPTDYQSEDDDGASTSSSSGYDSDDDIDFDEEDDVNAATRSIIKVFLRSDLGSILVVEEHPPGQDGRLYPPIRSLRVYEAAKNTTLRQAQDASEHNCRPMTMTVEVHTNPMDQQTKLSYLAPNDMDASASRNYNTVETTAAQAFARQQTEANHLRHLMEMAAQHSAAGAPVRRDIAGRPENPSSSIDPAFFPLPAGRTAILGPKAETPVYLIDFLLHYGNEVGKILGVPAVLTGDVLNAVAVNQTVMFVFSGMIFERRMAHGRIVREFCRFYFGEHIKEVFRKHAMKIPDAERTHGDLESLRRSLEVHVSFHGMTDPLIVNDLYSHGAIDEKTYCRSASAYTGLSENAFRPDRMKEMYDLKIKQMKIAATPPPAPAEPATAAASKPSAPKPASSSFSSTTTSSSYGKRSSGEVGAKSKPSDMKQNVNGALAKHGGVSTKAGAAAAKDHNPQRAHAKKQ